MNPAKKKRQNRLGIILPAGIVLILAILAFVIFWPRSQRQPSLANIAVITLAPATPTPSPSSTPTPTPTLDLAKPSTAAQEIGAAVPMPPDSLLVEITPEAEAAGWASDVDGRSHFDGPGIHVGFFQGKRYVGILRFDLSSVPLGSEIAYAGLELMGLDGNRLRSGGDWRLKVITADVDVLWAMPMFAEFEQAQVDGSVASALAAGELAAGRANVFALSPGQRNSLMRHIPAGMVAFRLDGPGAGEDNLFTWDAGIRLNEELDTKPILRLVVIPPTSPPLVIVTSTPTPENVVTAAAVAARATLIATSTGTFTPTPENWVTPVILVPSPTPANQATADHLFAIATADALVYGTPTPTPPNVWTATPTLTGTLVPSQAVARATAVPLLVPVKITPVATPTTTPTALALPQLLVDKIGFLSDRPGGGQIYVVNPDGTGLAVLTDSWAYEQAVKRDRFSPDQRYRAFVKNVLRDFGNQASVFALDYFWGSEKQVTQFSRGIAYAPAWSPVSDRIALVSNESGNDEIWAINRDGSDPRQLTQDTSGWWDKHPSWSPDGRQIVFWSNRSGERQLWIMEADGRNPHMLVLPGGENWDPVWFKSTELPRYAFDE